MVLRPLAHGGSTFQKPAKIQTENLKESTHLMMELQNLCTTWAAEPPGQWGCVPTIFWEIVCHFQKYITKVFTTNGSKVTGVSIFPPCLKPSKRP